MGGGRWDTDTYKTIKTSTATRALNAGMTYAAASFAYSNSREAQIDKRVHPNLDPVRIKSKPFKKLESRDSKEHPESNAVLVCFDVTGSNYDRAVEAQQKLGNLMDMLEKYLPDPQLAIASNDDFKFEPERSVQISDFESDNRVDEHLKNVILVGEGGGNNGESYDLVLYAAARKTILDCVEKRPTKGYIDAKKQYEKLFGEERVLTLQDPSLICEFIDSDDGINEEKIADGDTLMKELIALGNSKEDATRIIKTAAQIKRKFKFDEAAAGDK